MSYRNPKILPLASLLAALIQSVKSGPGTFLPFSKVISQNPCVLGGVRWFLEYLK